MTWRAVAVKDSVGDDSTVVHKPFWADNPSELPAGRVQELTTREYGHSTIPVVSYGCEAFVLQAVESEEVVDLIREDQDVRAVV